MVYDYCDTVALELLQESETVEYLAGQDDAFDISFEELLAFFAVDADHEEFCTPLSLSVTTFGLSGPFEESWITEDTQEEVVRIEIDQLAEAASF